MSEDTLNIKIKAEDLYSSTLAQMEGNFAKAAVAVSGSLAAIGATMVSLTNEAATVSAELLKWSQITGVNVRELSKLRTITAEAGGNIEQMFDVLKELNVKMKEAQDGTGAFAENVKHLGVQFEDSEGNLRDTTQVFIEVTAALNKLENAALRTAIADELFSDAGTELLPVLLEQKDAIAALTEETDAYSNAVTEEQAKAAKEFQDNMNAMKAAAEGLRVEIGNQLIPVANAFFDIFKDQQIVVTEQEANLSALTEELEKETEALKELEAQTRSSWLVNVFAGNETRRAIGLSKSRIESLKQEIKAIKEKQEAEERAPSFRIPGARGDVALREQLVEQQLQDKRDLDAQLLQSEIELQAQLTSIERQNAEANRELRQNDIDAEIEQYMLAYDMEYEAVQMQNERIGLLMLDRSAAEEQRRKDDLKATQTNERLKLQAVSQGASNAVSLLQNLNQLALGENKSLFDALKVASIAEATINTYTGATKALKDYPFPYSTVVAGLVVAAGLAQIAVISSQSFEGGGSTGSIGAGAGGSTAPVTSAVPIETATAEQPREQAVTVIINNPMGTEDWDQLAEDEIIPAFRRANRRNIQTTF